MNNRQIELKKTPLEGLHIAANAKMTAFAGFSMPVHYSLGVLKEHLHCRSKVGLFDVSHMGQIRIFDVKDFSVFETLMPADVQGLSNGQMRYSFLTNLKGGIIDDVIMTRWGDELWFVVNAACQDKDIEHLRSQLSGKAQIDILSHALLALQGPQAEYVLSQLIEGVSTLTFMKAMKATVNIEGKDITLFVSRSGYTGEDGFEISMDRGDVEVFARALLAYDSVQWVGLGARDSLRLEAGLCLYGQDINEIITPIEAGLLWSISSRRRQEGQFLGEEKILQEIKNGTNRKRVGLELLGRIPARQGTIIESIDGEIIGDVTSGCFSPSLQKPIAMGYVNVKYAQVSTKLHVRVRGKALEARVVSLPFVPHAYVRNTGKGATT